MGHINHILKKRDKNGTYSNVRTMVQEFNVNSQSVLAITANVKPPEPASHRNHGETPKARRLRGRHHVASSRGCS